MGTPLPHLWSDQKAGLVRTYGLVTLGVVNLIPQTESAEYAPARLEASILARAPHPRSAREFIKWLSDRDAYKLRGPLSLDAPSIAARTALGSVLFGRKIGEVADKQMATFNAQIAQQTALGIYGSGLLDGMKVDIDKSFVRANDRFAVVQLRAVMESRAAFGVAHAVVVLRTDEAGQWRVLQLTPNLAAEQQEIAWQTLGHLAAASGGKRWRRSEPCLSLLPSTATIARRPRSSGGTILGRERWKSSSGKRDWAIAGRLQPSTLWRRTPDIYERGRRVASRTRPASTAGGSGRWEGAERPRSACGGA